MNHNNQYLNFLTSLLTTLHWRGSTSLGHISLQFHHIPEITSRPGSSRSSITVSRCWVGEWRGRKRREEGKEFHPPSSCPAACRAILGPLHQIHSTRQQKYKKTVATQIRKTVITQIHLGRLWQIECVGSWLDLVVVAGMSQPRCQHSGYLGLSGPRNTRPHPHTNTNISLDTNTIRIDQEIQQENCT